jgi:BASS family bile acid:Na+ symporter
LVILHNFAGFVIGYYVCHLLNLEEKISRTIAIEIAMQNSGLATALAIKYFTVISAIPGAFYSVWHNISGSLIAAYWKRKKD